jgi:glycosyltransferase involved in cell wall biosynthesis
MSRPSLSVLHVVEAIVGGLARHVTDVVTFTEGVRHEVAMPRRRPGWPTDYGAEVAMREAGAVIHRVEMRRLPVHPVNSRAFIQLSGLIRARRPDVVHGHSAVGGALGRVAGSWVPAARVYTPNGVLTTRTAVGMERMLGRRTDQLIAVSESEAELVVRLKLVSPDRVTVIHNGVDLRSDKTSSARDLRAEVGLSPDAPLVGFVGRLGHQKAPEIFVQACRVINARRPDIHFLIIGTGPLEASVAEAVARSGLGDRWHHLTSMPGIGRMMGQLDVLALPSRYEGLPYVALEAMREGTPVVATDVVGSRDVVADGSTGLLVPPEDPTALAAAVCRVMDDPGLRSALSHGGRAAAHSRFDVRQQAAAHLTLYRRLASQVSRAVR